MATANAQHCASPRTARCFQAETRSSKAAADYVFDWLGEGCAPEFVLERIRLTAEGTIIASGSFHTVPRREGFLNSDGSGCDKHAPQRFLLIAARSDRLEMSTAISRWFWAEGR